MEVQSSFARKIPLEPRQAMAMEEKGESDSEGRKAGGSKAHRGIAGGLWACDHSGRVFLVADELTDT